MNQILFRFAPTQDFFSSLLNLNTLSGVTTFSFFRILLIFVFRMWYFSKSELLLICLQIIFPIAALSFFFYLKNIRRPDFVLPFYNLFFKRIFISHRDLFCFSNHFFFLDTAFFSVYIIGMGTKTKLHSTQ